MRRSLRTASFSGVQNEKSKRRILSHGNDMLINCQAYSVLEMILCSISAVVGQSIIVGEQCTLSLKHFT